MTQKQSKEMAQLAYKALDDKKARDIRILDISEISVLADYFLIASGSNKNQVQAMVDNVQEELHKAGFSPRQIEGYQTASWILLDYGDIIVHIFDEENRLFYDLERIWRDGSVTNDTDRSHYQSCGYRSGKRRRTSAEKGNPGQDGRVRPEGHGPVRDLYRHQRHPGW